MLELKNINIHLSINDKPIIENFNFTLNNGDKAVVIGEEGNGKSTLLKLIYDENLIDSYCTSDGNIIKKGKLAYLPQMIDESLLDLKVSQYCDGIDVSLHYDILSKIGLSMDFLLSKQKIRTLSGGEKIKMQLVKILTTKPDVLLLDEPTNDIDINTLEWLEGFISQAKLPILFISHDETLIENTANVIIHIEQLKRKTKSKVTVVHMGYSDYVRSRSLDFDKQMQIAKKQRSDHEKQMEKWQQIYNRVDHEQKIISRANPSGGRLLKKKMKSIKSQEKRLELETEDFVDIPQIEEAILTKFSNDIYIPSQKIVLDFVLDKLCVADRVLSKNIALKIVGNEHIGIIGRNGVGKSTLLNKIWEALKDRGDIIPSYMPQNYANKLDYNITSVDFLAENYKKDDITKARTYMGSMKFTHEEMLSKIGNLSGGQRAKILFLDMVLKNANVLVLDEPTRNFSPLSSPVIRATLAEFGGAIISISHDRKYLDEVCDKVYELTNDGLFSKIM